MTELRDLFRENLKSLRKAKDYSQRELSQKCDYTRSYVGQLERGEKDPSFESLIRLADALNLSILDFFRNDREGLEVELTQALEEMTNFSENNIRSLTTMPEVMNWDVRLIGLLDPEGRIIDFNRTAFEFVRETREEIIGKPLWELSTTDKSRGHDVWVKKAIEHIHRTGKICRTDFEIDSSEMGEVTLEVTLLPMQVVDSVDPYISVEGQLSESVCETESPRDLDFG